MQRWCRRVNVLRPWLQCRRHAEALDVEAVLASRQQHPVAAPSQDDVSPSVLFVPRDSPSAYHHRFSRREFGPHVADIAMAPYAPHTSVVLRDLARLLRAEAVALQGAKDGEVLAAFDSNVPTHPLRSGCPLLFSIKGSDGFHLTKDAALKMMTASTAAFDTDATEAEANLAKEKELMMALELELYGRSKSQREDELSRVLYTTVVLRFRSLSQSTSDPRIVSTLAIRRYELLCWLRETLQGFTSLCADSGNWQSAVVTIQELHTVRDWLVEEERAAATTSSPHMTTLVSGNTALLSSDPVLQWRHRCLPALRTAVRDLNGVDGATLTRVVTACSKAKQFDIAFQLMQQAVERGVGSVGATLQTLSAEGQFAVQREALMKVLTADALAALANCIATAEHLKRFRELFCQSDDALKHIPVSTDLYSALIHACARCVDEPNREGIALSLYRHLRDHSLPPNVSLYEGLIRVSASVGNSTSAFAFFHEARATVGLDGTAPTSRIYAALISAYVREGHIDDAVTTLDVLIEAGAPLNRDAFHNAMSRANFNDVKKLLQHMTSDRYDITPTATTYAYVLGSLKRAQGVSNEERLLMAFDHHEKAMSVVAQDLVRDAALRLADGGGDSSASSTTALATEAPPSYAVDARLVHHHPDYVKRLEEVLLRLRPSVALALLLLCPPSEVAALGSVSLTRGTFSADAHQMLPFLAPMVQVAQRSVSMLSSGLFRLDDSDVSEVEASLAPQRPTQVPHGSQVAVLCGDVLCSGAYHALAPVLHKFSAVVIPYSAIVELRRFVEHRFQQQDTWKVRLREMRQSHREVRSGSFDRADDDPKLQAMRAVMSLNLLLKEHRASIHIGSLAEDLLCASQLHRLGLSRDPAAPKALPAPELRSRCVSFAATLLHHGVRREVAEVMSMLERDKVVTLSGKMQVLSRLEMYAASKATVCVVTKDRRVRAAAAALSVVVKRRQHQQDRVSCPPTDGDPFSHSKLHAQQQQDDSKDTKPRRAALLVHDPDRWPSWWLSEVKEPSASGVVTPPLPAAPTMAGNPVDDGAIADIDDEMLRLMMGETDA